jgi:hypothetical protein
MVATREEVLELVRQLPEETLGAAKVDLEGILHMHATYEEGKREGRIVNVKWGPWGYALVSVSPKSLLALSGILDSPDLAGDALEDSEALYDDP